MNTYICILKYTDVYIHMNTYIDVYLNIYFPLMLPKKAKAYSKCYY